MDDEYHDGDYVHEQQQKQPPYCEHDSLDGMDRVCDSRLNGVVHFHPSKSVIDCPLMPWVIAFAVVDAAVVDVDAGGVVEKDARVDSMVGTDIVAAEEPYFVWMSWDHIAFVKRAVAVGVGDHHP